MTALSNRVLPEDDAINPLDSLEEILVANNWVFSRMNNDELVVQVNGKNCEYRLFFIWQNDMDALQFCCQYDLSITENNMDSARRAVMDMNEKLWIGHFDIPADTLTPTFRHTCLMRGFNGPSSADCIGDMIDIALAQCERLLPLFTLLSSDQSIDEQCLALALMDTQGES